MAVSRSGRFMATGQCGMNADVRVWDLATGTCVHVLSEHDEGVFRIRWMRRSRSCGVAADGKLFVWDVETGAIVANGPCEPRDARAVAFSPVVVQGVFYTKNGVRSRRTSFFTASTPARGRLAARSAACTQTRVLLGDFRRRRRARALPPLRSTRSLRRRRVRVARARPDTRKGGALVSAKDPTEDGRFWWARRRHGFRVRVARPPTVLDSLDHVWKLKGAVTSLSFVDGRGLRADADGLEVVDKVVACTSEGMKYLCPTPSAREVRERGSGSDENQEGPELLEESHVAPVKLVTFAPQGAVFGAANADAPADADAPDIGSCVSASSDGALRGWTLDPRPRALMRASLRTGAVPLCVAVTRAATMTGWDDGNVRCHSNATGELWTLPDAHVGGVTAVGVAVGQHFFVTGGVKGEVRVWDARSRRLISTLKEHCQAVVGVECLGDDVHVVSASRDRSIITWDLVRERRVAQHTQRVGSINAFELHRADGRDARAWSRWGRTAVCRSGTSWRTALYRLCPARTRRSARARALAAGRPRHGREGPEREAVGLRDGRSAGGGARALRSRAGGGVFARRIDARQRGGRRDRHGVGRARGGAVRRESTANGVFFCFDFFFL